MVISAGQGLVDSDKNDDELRIVYQFTLSRRANGTIAAEKVTKLKQVDGQEVEFAIDLQESISMMRDYMAFLERQLLASQTAQMITTIMTEQMKNQKILAAVKGTGGRIIT